MGAVELTVSDLDAQAAGCEGGDDDAPYVDPSGNRVVLRIR
jgi:hypothetical protein